MLTLFVASAAMAEISHPDSSPIDVAIDRNIWQGGEGVHGRDSVRFYYADPLGVNGCESLGEDFFSKMYSGTATRSLRMGEVCGQLVVVYRDDEFREASGQLGLEFIAHHESFHLAVQIYGSSVPIEYLRNKRSEITGGSTEFFHYLAEYFSTHDVESGSLDKNHVCNVIFEKYSMLSIDERREVDGIVFWEWPAEYYAYRKLKSDHLLDTKSYENIRRAAGSYSEYYPGVFMGLLLDGLFGSRQWQSQVGEGKSMMDVLGAACSNDYEPLPRVNVRVKRMEFPLD